MSTEKMQEEVQKVCNMVNSFSFDPEEFCKLMQNQHRTLQQSFTRLCLEWLKTCGSDDYRYDGRNEASHLMCKALLEFTEKFDGLPLI